MPGITPYLWFDHQAEEAMNFYIATFTAAGRSAKVLGVTRYGDAGPGPKGSAMMAVFELDGQRFMALNGGPVFKFTEAISFLVSCKTQQEVDTFWEKLTAGGSGSRCGWLKDKYGLSWQIIPDALSEMLRDPDPQKSGRVMQAMLAMAKIDIETLRRAYRSE